MFDGVVFYGIGLEFYFVVGWVIGLGKYEWYWEIGFVDCGKGSCGEFWCVGKNYV